MVKIGVSNPLMHDNAPCLNMGLKGDKKPKVENHLTFCKIL